MSDRPDANSPGTNSSGTGSLGSQSTVTASASGHQFDWLRWPAVWLFVVFNASDIVLTYVLIGHFGHMEGNPLAAYVVYGWGLRGMIWMKLGVVTLLCVAVHFVSQTKPELALRVIRFGAVAVGVVVIYSLFLLSRAAGV